MANGGTDQFRKEQVGRMFSRDLDRLAKARSRIEHNKAVGRGSKDSVEGGRRVLEAA